MGKGFDLFIKNPYWKRYYEDAPSLALKEYIRLGFENSPFVTNKRTNDYVEERNRIASRFTNEDWQYLIDHTTSGLAKSEYSKHIETH